jgi:hypothetical protein
MRGGERNCWARPLPRNPLRGRPGRLPGSQPRTATTARRTRWPEASSAPTSRASPCLSCSLGTGAMDTLLPGSSA